MTRHRILTLHEGGRADVVEEHEMGTCPFKDASAIFAVALLIWNNNGGAVGVACEWWHETHASWDRYWTKESKAEAEKSAVVLKERNRVANEARMNRTVVNRKSTKKKRKKSD